MTESPKLVRYQIATVALLFLGYAGYYFCRSDLSVAIPLIIDELGKHGMDVKAATVSMGSLVSFGVLAYAAGKLTLGGVADFLGGKRNFLGGMIGAILFTVLFTITGALPVFTLAWIGNRYLQAAGWAGLVKVTSRWFSYSSYGAVMGVMSLSFLVGDAVARQLMGLMIQHGAAWRQLFWFAAAVLCVLLVANALFLRESRTALGLPEPEVNPVNLFCADRNRDKPRSVAALLGTLLRSPLFLLVCALSLGCTLVRETFNTWTPTYFHQFVGFNEARSASASALFPAIGAVSVLLAGWLSDRLGERGRSVLMFIGLLGSALALFALTVAPGGGSGVLAVVLVSVVALGLLGPYSYLAGAMAMDFGGKQGGAASSGLIDGIGYLGGALAGDSMARIATAFGWQKAFLVLGVVCLLSSASAGVLFFAQKKV